MDKIAFGKRLKAVLHERQISVVALAKECGVTTVCIRKILGSLRLPSLPLFLKICNVLHLSPNYLLADDLELDVEDQLSDTFKRLQQLTPKQIDIVNTMIQTMSDK